MMLYFTNQQNEFKIIERRYYDKDYIIMKEFEGAK